MPDEIIIDGLEEHAFRRSIESMLRHGRADEAAAKLKNLLPEVCGAGSNLPRRLLEITSGDLTFTGWDRIAARLEEYGRPEVPITAIGIGICDPQDSGLLPDEHGNLNPPLVTTYYSDATFPFSQTDREDLLEGYSSFGCEWQGDHDRSDHTLSIEGIDDIYGAIAALETKVAQSDAPSPQDIRCGAIGACYLGVLVFQAARDAVIRHGLPRPLAILLVNSDAYPFFDAPVLTCDEYLDNGEVQVVERVSAALDMETDEPEEMGSLTAMGIAGAKAGSRKKMALALEGDEASNPLGMADELVAQAAFDPGSFDLSRYMPQPAPPREDYEVYEDDFDEGDGSFDTAPELGERTFEEIQFPVEAILPEPAYRAPAEEPTEPKQGCEAANFETAPFEEPFTESGPEPSPDPEVSAVAKPEYAAYPPMEENLNGPRYDEASGLQVDREPQQQPAGHALRSRIRIAPPVEETPSALERLSAGFTAIVKRVQDMLLRR